MSKLPQHWQTIRVDEAGSVQLGRQRSPEHHAGPFMRPYLRVANVYENRIDTSDVLEMNFTPQEAERFGLKYGDILLNEGQSRELVGRPAMYRDEVPGACFQNTLLRFRAYDHVDPQYALGLFRYYLRSGMFQNVCRWTTNIAHLGAARFAAMPFPLPPLEEQKRIADKLDRLLAAVDSCKARLDAIPAILKRFRQSVLAAATSGALTEEWREDKGVAFSWRESSLQAVAIVSTGSTPLRAKSEFYSESGTPWITSAATGQQVVRESAEYVTDAAITAHRLRKYPVGTLLVAMYGEGKTRGQVTELGIEATINQACAAIIVDSKKVEPRFVKLSLQANYLQMRDLAEGGNQPNLNLSKVKAFALLVPNDSREQLEVIRRVDELFSYADRVQSKMATTRAKFVSLASSLLLNAFRGDLNT